MIQERSFGVIPLRQKGSVIEALLVVHKGGKHWGFPKGHPESGETALETAQRELLEETGLTVSQWIATIPYEESYVFYKGRKKIYKTVCYFPAFVTGSLCLQKEEIIQSDWLPIKEALIRLTFPESKKICSDVYDLLVGKSICIDADEGI